MNIIGNHRIGIQETDDDRFGWESAERGEPIPEWNALAGDCDEMGKLEAQRLGWQDFKDRASSRVRNIPIP